jgi:carbamoyltransferase
VRIREQLNLIKGREEFQPYAASVLEDKAHEWFEVDRPSHFMLFAKKVRPEKKAFIPAVLHADDTSRIQTVDRRSLPIFYELIKEFERLTNVPLLLNTSFNRKGEPIVCSPEDALECFFASPLEYLAIGGFLIEK